MSENTFKSQVINVRKLLQYPNLKIPQYQRPYKWTSKNILQLFKDINTFKTKSAYRLGTIVIHQENGELNIVDGQQRTVTLILMVKAILNSQMRTKIESPNLENILKDLEISLFDPSFQHEISISNIHSNYREIERLVESLDEETVEFLLEKCEFTQFVLSDISEAFQFFDSQNARGKDLEPHDLLKAFHLREFSEAEKIDENKIVQGWESMETDKVSKLFGEYLFRMKGWCKGNSSRYFTKNEVSLFKGININTVNNYPFTEITRIAHFYVDRYNTSYERHIDFNQTIFPFQLDQTIINGKRFFEMISHYKKITDHFEKEIAKNTEVDKRAREVLNVINDYEGMHRTGDKYIRMLFDCALIFYVDKFGFAEISRVIEKLFVWAYKLRLRHQSVYLASVDNYVVAEINVFRMIADQISPQGVLALNIPPINRNDVNATKTDKIRDQFNILKYYE